MAVNESEHSSFERRLDALDARTQKQNDILVTLEKQNNAIENMGQSLKRIERTVDDVGTRVRTLEAEPGERWKKIAWEFVKYAFLGGLGLIAGLFFRGV